MRYKSFRAAGKSRRSIDLASPAWTKSDTLWKSAVATTRFRTLAVGLEKSKKSNRSQRHALFASQPIQRHTFCMHRILAITNQKGGVGKTTTSVNLAASLAATKRRVLLIDLDPQGTATMGSGIDKLTLTVDKIRATLNPALQVEGVLRTMVDPRNYLATEVSSQLVAHFGERVYRTVIPRNVRVAEAPSHGLPVLLYDKTSRGAQAYLALAGEVLRRAQAQQSSVDVAEPALNG